MFFSEIKEMFLIMQLSITSEFTKGINHKVHKANMVEGEGRLIKTPAFSQNLT